METPPVNDLLWKTLQKLSGSCAGSSAAQVTGKRLPPGLLRVSFNPSRQRKGDLVRRGFDRERTYVALPSAAAPRWLFPLDGRRLTRAGLGVYAPYAPRARVMKGLLEAFIAAHGQSLAPNRLVVASAGELALEELVRDVTGEERPAFSMSLGGEARYRKLTVQVMRAQGEILGYIKLPISEEAADRVRWEGEVLQRLSDFPALRPHIPRVLYCGDWRGDAVLFESAGPLAHGPTRLDRSCAEFLQLLWGVSKTHRAGLTLCEEVATEWQKTASALDAQWRALGEAALETARWELARVDIPCGVGHGDFAPWNTRSGDAGLFVFDWESARWGTPVLWDIFHFITQAAALLKQNHVPTGWHRWSGERASFLLYLLHSACQLSHEDSPLRAAGLECRRQLLTRQLNDQ